MTVRGLPRSLTTFIGREEQIADTLALLGDARLVTLTGPGGSGKTRLATAVADQWTADGWFVDLVPVSAGQVAPSVISAILDRPAEATDTLGDAVDVVGEDRVLLVLDNCEHVIEPVVATVTEILTRCPGLTVLATSRESLGVDGEVVSAVPPMTHPDLRELPTAEALLLYDAIALFVDRLRRSAPQLRIGDAEGAVIARIVAKLDGLPLAMELAAARARVLSLEEIDARLKDRFELLTGRGRTTADRHRTLRGTIEWSFSSLPEKEARLLTRLTVFAGSFDLAAVEAVCADEELPQGSIIELLTGLVQRSLVVADTGGPSARYRLLETIREFALERLPADEAADLRAAHRGYYTAFAHRSVAAAESSGRWDALLEELPNVRTAATSALADDDIDGLADLLHATAAIWREAWGPALFDLAERAVEGATHKRLEAARVAQRASSAASMVGLLNRAGQLSTKARAHEAVIGETSAGYDIDAGWARWFLYDRGGARTYFERALRAARDSGDRLMEAEILQALGWAESRSESLEQPDLARARELHEAALVILRSIGASSKRIGLNLARTANLVASQHDHATEKRLIRELYEVGRKSGDQEWLLDAALRDTRLRRVLGDMDGAKEAAELMIAEVADDAPEDIVAWSLAEAAQTFIECGEPARGAEVAASALRRLDEAAFPYDSSDLLCVAAVAEELLGRHDKALDLLRASRRLLASTDDVPGTGEAHGFGRVLLMRGHIELGVKMMGLSLRRYYAPCAEEVPFLERYRELARARQHLGAQRYDDLLAEGTSLPRDQRSAWFDEALHLLAGGVQEPAAEVASMDLSATEVGVTFQGARATVPMSKGIRFLALLVSQPGREMHVAELTAAVDGAVADPHTTSGVGPLLDERAATELRRRARILEAEMAEAREWADPARADRARIELEAIADQLSSAFGFGGRPRPQGDATERLRKAVWNRLKDAMDRIEQVHPTLAEHLRRSISTGIHCAYAPEAPVTWRVSRDPATQT